MGGLGAAPQDVTMYGNTFSNSLFEASYILLDITRLSLFVDIIL